MNDPYLDDARCIKRLCEEYERYGSIICAYDFDSTIFDYYGDGSTFDLVIDALRECRKLGFHLTVFTSCNEDRFPQIKAYLEANNIPYDGINETPDFIPFRGRKVYYNILLDDRAGLSASYNHLISLFAHIRSIKATQNLNEIA